MKKYFQRYKMLHLQISGLKKIEQVDLYNQVKADELKHPIVNTGKTLRTMMKLEGDK